MRTWITFFGLSILMALNNIYSTLLTGWGNGGSIVAVILCLLFLGNNERDAIRCNLGQTMASAGGSVGFSVAMLASIYYLNPDWNPPLLTLAFFILGLSTMGVALAVPLRSVIIHWFFPSAVACATIIKSTTSKNDGERFRVQKIMGIFGSLSFLLTIPTKAALKSGESVLWSHISLVNGLNLSLDPLLYGIGIVVGTRIGFSMLLGAVFHHFFLIPHLGKSAAEFSRWSAVGLMTLPALTSTMFTFIFKRHKPLPPGFAPRESSLRMTKFQSLVVISLFLCGFIAAAFSIETIFHIRWQYITLASIVAVPLCFALGKIASETDINPVRLIAIVLLVLFSLLGNFLEAALLSVGIAGASLASIAVDLFYDLRTGYLINAKPKQQIIVQFLAIIPVSFISIYFLHALSQQFGFGKGKYFPAPAAIVWASMAEVLVENPQQTTPFIWNILLYSSIIGIFLTFTENLMQFGKWSPSPFAIGISLLLPSDLSLGIFAGSVLGLFYMAVSKDKQQAQNTIFQAGSAVFAASALAGVVTVILISLGILHLPSK